MSSTPAHYTTESILADVTRNFVFYAKRNEFCPGCGCRFSGEDDARICDHDAGCDFDRLDRMLNTDDIAPMPDGWAVNDMEEWTTSNCAVCGREGAGAYGITVDLEMSGILDVKGGQYLPVGRKCKGTVPSRFIVKMLR